ncbi:signal recognition particle-docking protein FtsY [Mesorhizobium ephedrae]|uniref:Signal recognition particle receptor FtsY n=1 Tax=Kumtagia ephedrae TaxID=2116701 RepID=A0A2P7RSK7_9HYPH|nr:signal recognition particle-docking protein FtsY [Mesorhizobium ephedrae]
MPQEPAETPPPSAAEVTPSGPSGHLPLEGGEDAEAGATPPSPSRGGSVGEADRGGVADEARDASSPVARVAEEAPRAAEITPSGPSGLPGAPIAPQSPRPSRPTIEPPARSEDRPRSPLKGGEDAEPTPPSPLRGGPVGEADRGGVADEARDASSPVARVAEEAPSAAEVTPSGPSGLPGAPIAPQSPRPSRPTIEPPARSEDRPRSPLKGGEDAEPAAPGKVTVGKAVEKKAEPEPAAPAAEPRKSWFQRLRDGLSRSSRELTGSIAGIFTKRKLDEETLEELEDVLIRADLGMETALRVTDTLASSRYGKDVSDAEVRAIMAQEVEKVLGPVARPLELDLSHKPHVILVVGVNGTGKTTTIGKLAAKLSQGGLSVMLAAGDTFRAAAIEQLKIWGERTGSPVVSSKLGADAAGLAWDAFEKAREAGSDVLIIDTAGRLQNKAELMAELEKIVRVLGKHDPEAPHTVLQTVDATTGQNALNQVEIFRNVAGVNGLVMTKLDGTARGGILVAIAAKHKLPVYFIGVGEQVDDLEPFSAGDFAKAIAGVG